MNINFFFAVLYKKKQEGEKKSTVNFILSTVNLLQSSE